MVFKVLLIFLIKVCITIAKLDFPDHVVELTDEKWDQIQKGQWLVGFFDKDTQESHELEKHWILFSSKCKDLNINVGRVFAPQNPGLYIRFLVTVFPKVFYMKNGVAHEVKNVTPGTVAELISNQNFSNLKPVNFLKNPFSVQMSLLSHLFVHAVNLYNFENAIVQKFISAPSATDVAFGLTFIVVGTVLGLLMTCAFGVIQIFFMDSKESENPDGKKESDDEKDDDEEEEEPKKEEKVSEKSTEVRKRK